MLKNKKIAIIVGGIVLVIGIFLVTKTVLFRKTKELPKTTTETQNDVIPTIDSSVNVLLTKSTDGKEVTLTINNISQGTQSIDYELSYKTKKQGLQGVIGTIKTEGEKDYEKKLTLGTCSSGNCVYHEVEGTIKLNLKFSGDYGEKIFEKEYPL